MHRNPLKSDPDVILTDTGGTVKPLGSFPVVLNILIYYKGPAAGSIANTVYRLLIQLGCAYLWLWLEWGRG
jgi:hypothetical protein